jgi:hypothetical protein
MGKYKGNAAERFYTANSKSTDTRSTPSNSDPHNPLPHKINRNARFHVLTEVIIGYNTVYSSRPLAIFKVERTYSIFKVNVTVKYRWNSTRVQGITIQKTVIVILML